MLLWQPRLRLDANGEATVTVPLNDSLTRFRLVAVADAGVQTFGTGATSIRVSQDLQLLAGLPPLVRQGDHYQAMVTLRNTTARGMTLRASLTGTASVAAGAAPVTPLLLPPQDLVLAAGAARQIGWPVDVPALAERIQWAAAVVKTGPGGASGIRSASDRVTLHQAVQPAVPLRVLQATFQPLDGRFSMPVAAPAEALALLGSRQGNPQGSPQGGPQAIKRGGLLVAVQPRLTGELPGVRRYFEAYPYTCPEHQASKALGLHDAALWAALANSRPTYLDADGLASYFAPPPGEAANGSDRLTAYLLAASHEAGVALPPAARDAMLDGLTACVQVRIQRQFWSPRPDLDVRKLAAIEALARHGRAQPRWLASLNLTPQQWPTAAVIDWLAILQRLDGVPDRDQRLTTARQVLRSRLTWTGTTLNFSAEAGDHWWWLMDNADANASRLILAVLDDPAWRGELPRLVVGSLGRQRQGAWSTTTANLWGVLALDKFAAKFESAAVTGRSVAVTAPPTAPATPTASAAGVAVHAIDWAATPQGGRLMLPWPAAAGTLDIAQQGSGQPWLTVQSLAAVPLAAPIRAGYTISRSVTAVQRKDPAAWSRGDVLRVRLQIDAQADMTWVVVSDPVPAGATILGSGGGRDSAIATRGERPAGSAWPAFDERGFDAMRRYFAFMPRGVQVIEYMLRLNNAGRFGLPPSRIEAMYAPEQFGEAPNAPLQRVALAALRQQLVELSDRNVEDGAIVVLDNASGEVRAWVGSSGSFSDAPAVDGVLARRQSGSTLKPFVYGLAFEQRLITPASLLDDSPAQINTAAGLYLPQNYDRRFRGWVSARTALGASPNVPAVRAAALLGPDALVQRLNDFGLALPEPSGFYGHALALGAADVTLLALTNAYRALANGGWWSPVAGLRGPEFANTDARAAGNTAAGNPAPPPPRGRRCGGAPGQPHPGRQQRARRQLRARQCAGHARLRGGEDRHQQRPARRLMHRLHRPLHRGRVGGQRQRRGDASGQWHQRCRAGVARAGATGACRAAVAAATAAARGRRLGHHLRGRAGAAAYRALLGRHRAGVAAHQQRDPADGRRQPGLRHHQPARRQRVRARPRHPACRAAHHL